jgi:uncharacterized protein
MSKIEIKKSKIHGEGVFAKKNIKKGEVVFIVKGKIIKWDVLDQKTSLYGPDWIGIDKNHWIDPKGAGKYLNHSCKPNCGIKGKVCITAIKNINIGEEITIDYSISEIDNLWYMDCTCNSTNCRKKVRSIQFLPKKTYARYHPFIPTYFKKVYNKM